MVAVAVGTAACTSSRSATTQAPGNSTSFSEPSGGALTTGPTSAPATTGPTSASATSSAWPTYHATNDRNGRITGVSRPASLSRAWSAGVDGAVYGQPLVVGTSVIAATENDTVYAFSLTTGALRWRSHLASPVARSSLPCGDISPLGITGTPAFDPVTGSVFVVTETTGGSHDLVALDALSGAVRFTRNLDLGGHDRLAQQERGALAVANGRVYVAFGGLYGDCGDYVGYVTATPTTGVGTIGAYVVPTAREGGIWAPPGPAIAADGTVYVAVGNGASTGGAYDGTDAVLHLTADLSSRLDYFAPAEWAAENASDADLGSTGPLLLSDRIVVQVGKDGRVYVLDASKLGGIGHPLASGGPCAAYGGSAADGNAVFEPCEQGLRRFDVTPTAVTPGWHATVTGSPVVAGGAVWALDTDAGTLHAYDEATGANLATARVGAVTRFTSPVIVPGLALVGTRNAVTAFTIGS
jgi:outer membrane protein assembly factor BamB